MTNGDLSTLAFSQALSVLQTSWKILGGNKTPVCYYKQNVQKSFCGLLQL